MNDLEKVIELIEKEFLSEDQRILLNDLISKDPKAKKIYDAYSGLKSALKRNEHIDEELMAEYVMFKNGLSSERLIILLANKVEDHIRKCEKCERLFTELNAEYCDVDNYINQTLTEQVGQNKSAQSKEFFLFNSLSKAKYAFTSLAAVAVLYLGLLTVSSITTPDYKKSFLDGEDFYATRGRTSELFQRGLDAIDRNDYESAIKFLNDDISNNKSDESIFYTHFILGITYVNKAESDFIGLFKSFNRDDVKKGIENFKKSIALNNSGKFDNLKLDANYFIGKSYLMIDDKKAAVKYLQLVVDQKGSYYKKAEELLKEL